MAKSKKKGKSRFGANVMEVIKKHQTNSGVGYLNLPKDVKLFKEEPGKVTLDIIPYIVSSKNHPDANPDNEDTAHVGNPWYRRPIWVHKNVGTENKGYVCLKSVGKKCPICQYREDQLKKGVSWEDAISKPQLRNLYVVIPLGHKKYDEVPHIWDISHGNFQAELEKELAENSEFWSFPDLEEGYSLKIRFTEESFNKNKYSEASRIDFVPREHSYEESLMEEVPDLDSILKVLSYEALEAVFLEMDSSEDDDEDEDAPKSKRSKKSVVSKTSKRKPEKDDDDENDDENTEEEEEEEEEEEAPSRRSKKVAAPAKPAGKGKKKIEEDDDENDDEEEEEEEEEEKPKPGDKHKTVPPSRLTNRSKKKPEPEDDEEEEEEEEPKPKKGALTRGKKEVAGKSAKGKCPSGHRFGKDWDEMDDCDDCPLFDKCGDANEEG